MKTHTEVTAESGISRSKCVTVTPCTLVKIVWELPSQAPPYNHAKLLHTVFLPSKVLRAGANCICKHLKVLSECRAGYSVLKPEGEAAVQGLEMDPAPKLQPLRSCPEYRVGPRHQLCQLKPQKGPFSWE